MILAILVTFFIIVIIYLICSLFVFTTIFKCRVQNSNYIEKKINQLTNDSIQTLRDHNVFLYDQNRKETKFINTKYGNIYCEFVFAKSKTKKTIICCHGYKSTFKNFISGLYPCYGDKELEYNLCVFDFYGCGLSSGKFLSIGQKTNEAITNVLNEAINVFGEDIEIYLHGISFGAYHALRFLIDNDSSLIKGLIFDSGFLSPSKQIKHLLRRSIFIIFFPVLLIWYKLFFGESAKKANLENTIIKLKKPLMIFHSIKDTIVPVDNAYKLFKYCLTKKQINTFKNSEHGLSCFDETDEYRRRVKRFIENEHLNRICLIGFMSAGKTSLGKMIADKYGREFIDIDEIIVKKTGKDLSVLFSESEAEFRKMEFEQLIDLSKKYEAILACGGGTPQISGSYNYLKKWTIIYLQTSSKIAFERSKNIKSFAKPWEGFKELCETRIPIFEYINDFICPTYGDISQSFETLCQIIENNNLLK